VRRDLDSLIGKLVWAAHVALGGALFLNRLHMRTLAAQQPHHHVTLNAPAAADLHWWLRALTAVDGRARLLTPAPVREFQTDARGTCDSEGPRVGAFVAGGFLSLTAERLRGLYPDTPPDEAPIAVWELFAVLVAVQTFPEQLAGACWRVLTDNPAADYWINRGTARRGPCFELTLSICHTLFIECLSIDLRLESRLIPGTANALADALSREQWRRFRGPLVGWAVAHHAPTPTNLSWLPVTPN
jgi:hypothetical protein